MLVISNRPRASRSADFEITRPIIPWIVLHSVQLLLLISFHRSRVFHFVTRSREILLKFWAPKAAFRRNSVIIDFLVNKLIFSQTKYVVICFTLKPRQPENMSRIYFLAVAAIFWKCLIFGAVNKTWIGFQIELVFSLLVENYYFWEKLF